jgi:hypothetical protein
MLSALDGHRQGDDHVDLHARAGFASALRVPA